MTSPTESSAAETNTGETNTAGSSTVPFDNRARAHARQATGCQQLHRIALAPEPSIAQLAHQGGLAHCTRCDSPELHLGAAEPYLLITCSLCNHIHVRTPARPR
jgi:hypothetical protein